MCTVCESCRLHPLILTIFLTPSVALFLGIHLNIRRYTRLSIHPSVLPFIHPSIHPSIYSSIEQSIHSSIHRATKPSILSFIYSIFSPLQALCLSLYVLKYVCISFFVGYTFRFLLNPPYYFSL